MVLLRSSLVGRRLLAGTLALAAGCAVFLRPFDGRSAERSFNHRLHVEGEGLDCAACHVGVEDDDRPGMPVLAQCRLCHEEPEQEGGPDLTEGYFDETGAFAHAPFSTLPDEVVFSHLGHVTAGVECAACHGDVIADARLGPSVSVPMGRCTECHERTGTANECATCHEEISKDWAPPSHAHGWTQAHGPAALAREGVAGSCQLCHVETSCTSCHLETPPADHTNYWRRRGHGGFASLDRTRCFTCHRRDSCEECHSTTAPVNHVGQWGGRRSVHCGSCHLPTARDEGCYLCHQGAPSHAQATPLPPDHTSGMNCRQCHGLGAPLPHFDNGDACSACHK